MVCKWDFNLKTKEVGSILEMNIFASAFILESVFLQVCLLLYAMELVIISI